MPEPTPKKRQTTSHPNRLEEPYTAAMAQVE